MTARSGTQATGLLSRRYGDVQRARVIARVYETPRIRRSQGSTGGLAGLYLDCRHRIEMARLEEEIERLHDDITCLRASIAPRDEAEETGLVTRTHALQHEQAERMRLYFERHHPFDADAADQAIQRADAILERYEDPS